MLLLSLRCELAATRVYFGGTGTRATATIGTAREQRRGPVADNPTLSSSTECRKDLGRVKHLTYTPRCWSQAREATSDRYVNLASGHGRLMWGLFGNSGGTAFTNTALKQKTTSSGTWEH